MKLSSSFQHASGSRTLYETGILKTKIHNTTNFDMYMSKLRVLRLKTIFKKKPWRHRSTQCFYICVWTR